MEANDMIQTDRIKRYAELIRKQTGKAIRPYRADGYVNMMTKYGTSKDTTEHYEFVPEEAVADEVLTINYESNGLFAKIIDTPSEEAVKHGFKLDEVSDQKVENFYTESLDELDWEEKAMTAIKWARLFGGALIVMLINDGRGLDEPLDWKNIRSIDDLIVYDRSMVQPNFGSVYTYDPVSPFVSRSSRFGVPEYYQVSSKYGAFTVHESRCLVFQNGILPENATNSIYQYWGIPEYLRIKGALRDTELAHHNAPKLLDKSVQAIYKMKGLSAELATEEGEDKVLKRLQVIDMARSFLNSLVIDSEGEDYDFKTFQFSGINDVVNASCNMLSALSNIPQVILFGQGISGMSSTDDTSMENYYNYVERIQKKMLKSNIRYLLSVVFQAGLATGEIDEIPKIKIVFNPLWSMSDLEQADLEQKRASAQQIRAQTAQIYVDMQAIDPSEVRRKLADSEEFNIETMLDEIDDDDLFSGMDEDIGTDTGSTGVAPATAVADEPKDAVANPAVSGQPAPTQQPSADGMAPTPLKGAREVYSRDSMEDTSTPSASEKPGSVGVLVIGKGKVLTGTRNNDFGYGLICGPGGKIESGETPEQAAFRETEEEFGIRPKFLIPIGRCPYDPEGGPEPHLFLCTDYEGELDCTDLEMRDATFRTLDELEELAPSLFQPFADGLELLKQLVFPYAAPSGTGAEARTDGEALESGEDYQQASCAKPIDFSAQKATIKHIQPLVDGGPGSGNFGHKGRPGKAGGSSENGGGFKYSNDDYDKSILGMHTSDGLKVKKIDPHMYVRAKERKVYPESIQNALKYGKPRPGNKENSLVYDYRGTTVVFNKNGGLVKTVIYTGKGKEHKKK